MKKCLPILLIVLISMFQVVNAADETGKGEKPIYRPNEVFDLSLHLTNETGEVLGANCNIGIKNSNYSNVIDASMNDIGDGWYNYTYQRSDIGTFFCRQNCSKDNFFAAETCDFIIQENPDNQFFLYIIAIITFFTLLGLGYFIEDETFIIIAGMLSIVMAINLFINGFPQLENVFLKNGITIVLLGIGFYFTLAPSVEVIETWRTRLDKID